MLKLTHIINPVNVGESSDLFVAQPITFESMRLAKQYASKEVEVNLVTTQYPEDQNIIPDYFNITPDLSQSILDNGTFNKKRKLPLIKDILQKAIDHDKDSDYIIYTNVDIALMPQFYVFIKQQIESGLDAFVINRRTISNQYTKKEELPLMYSEIGKSHPGFDCFIIKRELLDKFILNNVCIGISKIGVTLIANIFCFAQKSKVFESEHLTFHIGEDRVWQDQSLNDYFNFNSAEALKSFEELYKINPELIDNKIFSKHYKLLKYPNKKEVVSQPKQSFLFKLKKKIKNSGK